MKALKYLLPLWISIAVYSVLSLFYGAMGLSAYEQLLFGRDIQWANIKKLGAINSELENAQNNLLYDREIITIHAQSLGYGKDDENYIRIVGLGSPKNPYTAIGEIIPAPFPGFISDKIIKVCALITGITVLAIQLFLNLLRRQ